MGITLRYTLKHHPMAKNNSKSPETAGDQP